MPSRTQPRDHLGRFIRSAQPQQEELEPATPQAQVTRPNALQRILLAASTPLVSDVPVSEFISNIAQAYQNRSSPIPDPSESPPSLPFTSESTLSSPICYVPPLRHATNPSIPAPAFNAPGSDPIAPAPLPLQLPDASFGMLRQPAHLSDNDLSYTDEEPFVQLPPPLLPCPYQLLPWHPRVLSRTRPLPQSPHPRALPQPPLMLPPPAATYAPPATIYVPPTSTYTPPATTYAPLAATYGSPFSTGVGAMPSVRSKIAPHFSGDIEHPIKDFLDEYEGLANKYRLSGREKVETVTQYVDRSQRHVWQNLPGFINRDWDNFRHELCIEYVSPTPEGQFSRQKLVDFASKYARKRMEDKTDVINYQRQFNAQSKVLLSTGRITVGERNTLFWRGFHPDNQRALQEHLIAMHPNMPRGQAFNLQDVFNIARAIFSGDDDFLLQEPSPPSDHVQTERSSSRNHSSPRVETRTVRFWDDYPEEDDKEFKGLVYQLHAVPVRDLKYTLLYARCAARFPNHMRGIPKPGGFQIDTTASYSYQMPAPLPPPTWSVPAAAPVPTPATPAPNFSTAAPFLHFGPRPELCIFCRTEGHRLRSCPTLNDYVQSGHASWINDRIHLPNGQPVPFDGTRRGLKASIDAWLTAQTAPAAAQSSAVFTRETPPYLDLRNALTSRIEEVIESHILQVREATATDEDQDQDFSHDIFEVFATEKRKRGKALEFSAPPPPTSAPASASSAPRSNAQYKYHCDAEDQQLILELEDHLMQGKLSLTTPAHIFAASHVVRKNVAEKLKVRRVETNKYKVVSAMDPRPPLHRTTMHNNFPHLSPPPDVRQPDFCLPLLELDVLVDSGFKSPAILDTGSQIIVIRHDIVQSLGFPINCQRLIEMEGANGATNWTVGCAENLPMQVGDVTIKVHAHVVEHASFGLLLGRPFQKAALLRFEDLPNGEVEVSVRDPADLSRRTYLPTRPCTGHTPAVKVISVREPPSPPPSSLAQSLA